ncbi:hypothetical protein AU186_07770 [Mycobacterium sp. GA-1999]|nr:hypothetical protein AU185_23440 [Mycobacterium sp. GA-0227b]KUH92310.1 hypothetical protein AU186_07770 [Mycobacterium sp. GA-1999]
MREIVDRKFDIGVVDGPLQDPTIHLVKHGPDRLGFYQGKANRLFEHVRLYCALDYVERDDVPLRVEFAGFLRKPDVQLSAG